MRSIGWATCGIGLLFGCREIVPYRVESDFDADVDIDVDDGESTWFDTDSPGFETPYGGMHGTIHYDATLDHGPGCDARIELTGRTYEGGCPDCTFAFDVDAEVVSSGGSLEGCHIEPAWTFLEEGVTILPKLGFSPNYIGFENVLWFGYGLDLTEFGYGVYDGPFWTTIHYDGFSGDLVVEPEQVSWVSEVEFSYGYGASPYLSFDCIELKSYPAAPVSGGGGASDLQCDYIHMDVFEVEASAGAELYISADTVATDSAFQPVLIVTDPDGCIVGSNFSAYRCSYPPPQGQWCPALELSAPQDGTYRIIVQVYDGIPCADSTVSYELSVAGADGPARMAADDVYLFAEWRTLQLRTEMELELEWR